MSVKIVVTSTDGLPTQKLSEPTIRQRTIFVKVEHMLRLCEQLWEREASEFPQRESLNHFDARVENSHCSGRNMKLPRDSRIGRP